MMMLLLLIGVMFAGLLVSWFAGFVCDVHTMNALLCQLNEQTSKQAHKQTVRSGSTMVEMILFMALLAMSIGVVIALLMSANDNRIRQQTLSSVEQSGLQLMQTLSRRIRSAERIIDPPMGSSGNVLTLQMAATYEDPTIVSLWSGGIVVARHNSLQSLSATQVTILDLVVRNTSVSDARPSVLLSFTVRQQAALPVPVTYERPFEALITLFPDDEPEGNPCNCPVPVCTNGVYTWTICDKVFCFDPGLRIAC